MASRQAITEILLMLAATYPRFSLTKDTITAYVGLLLDIPEDALRAAALQCASSGDFFPSVHELRAAVVELHRKAQHIPSAYQAWEDVCNMPRSMEISELLNENGGHVIQHRRIEFSHDLVQQVAYQLGWPDSFPGENLSTDRAHFFKAYEYALAEAMGDQIRLPEVNGYLAKHEQRLLAD